MKLIVVEEFDTSGPSSVTFRKEGILICFSILILWCFNRLWIKDGGLGHKIASFSSWDFSWSNTHDIFWHFVSNGYFYVLFLWAIAVSDFCPLEIYKNLGLPVSTATFAVNNQADNHCYKYIYLFQILYSMKSVFF